MQIKLRGLRVEPGEVEDHISRVKGVARCVVVMRQSDTGAGSFLAAYIMPSAAGPGPSPAPARDVAQDEAGGLDSAAVGERRSLVERVRRALVAHVPDYMVPSAFVLLDNLPQTR